MRKNQRLLVALLVLSLLSAFTVVFLAGCGGTKTPEEGWTYVGTWVNPAYNGHGGQPPGKMVVTTTSMALYDNDTSPSAAITATFAVGEDWTSGGMHYFKGSATRGIDTGYFLVRISGNNNTLELNTSDTAYPVAIDPAGQYAIFARQ